MNRKRSNRPAQRRLSRPRIAIASLAILVLVGYITSVTVRPLATLSPVLHSSQLRIATPAPNLPWPAYGQAAFGLGDGTVIATHGAQTPIATASTAKIITALCVLEKRPLTPGVSGPSLTFGPNDVALYNQYVAQHGSVVAVSAGQQISERQALEALLLPSANNIADSLAIWAFGSVSAYTSYANQYVAKHGLSSTHVGSDASGFAPDSVSTASDLVKLGALAIQNATVAQIVAQPTAVFPGVGTIHNVDTLLGSNGIIGIKTGNSDQDGGVFLGAAKVSVGGSTLTVISAIAGASTLGQVLGSSNDILAAGRTTVASTTVIHRGDVLGTYQQPNGSRLQAVVTSDVNILMVRGDSVDGNVHLDSIAYDTRAGSVVGVINFPASKLNNAVAVKVVLKQAATQPSLWYRLLHP